MIATEMDLNPLRDALFVERTLLWSFRPATWAPITIDDLEQLVSGSESRRVWTVTGAPGSGKSWLLQVLLDKLVSRKLQVFWLDCDNSLANTAYKDSDKALHGWLASLKGRGDESTSLLQEAEVQHDRTVPAGLLLGYVARLLPRPSILIVDGYDDLNVEKRDFLEQWFLIPYLSLEQEGQQPARLVIALRDPDGVRAPQLRQDTASLTLAPLPALQNVQTPVIIDEQAAIEQIRRRCKRLAETNEARHKAPEPNGAEAIATYKEAIQRILEPPDALKDEDLARLYEQSPEDLEQIQDSLRDKLTGSPYINNLLLWRTLIGGPTDLTAFDQIRLRCEQLAKANEARHNAAEPDGAEAIKDYKASIERILEPPDTLKDEDLARLYEQSSEDLEQIQSGLRDKLTGNPYINNLLLWYALRGNDSDLSSEQIEKIWEYYLRRAGLLDENGEPKIEILLLEQIHAELDPEWTEYEFAAKFGYKKLDEVEPMFWHGILIKAEDWDGFRIHPDMVALLTLRQEASR